MASLPPRPVDKSPREDPRRYLPDDRDRRHGVVTRPMAPQSRYAPRREERGERISESDRVYRPRSRPPVGYDSYVAPNSYVASRYDSRREDEMRRYEPETYERGRDRERDRSYSERRQVWDRDRDRDREREERDRDRGRDSRGREQGQDHDRDRRQIYHRERGLERRRGDEPPYDRREPPHENSRRDPRPPGSPPRRAAPHDYTPESSFRRASRSPRHRQPSPALSQPPRLISRLESLPPASPPSKRIKLGNHSITNSPRSRSHSRSRSRSPSRFGRDRPPPIRQDAGQKQRRGERSASPPRTTHKPPSTTSEREAPNQTQPVINKTEDRTSPSTSAHSARTIETDVPLPRSKSRTPVPTAIKPESPTPGIVIPAEELQEEKGKLKEEPQNDADGDVKMREASPPKHPRYRGGAPMRGAYRRRTSRSPPKGPRSSYVRTPTTPTSPASFHHPPRGSRRPYPASSVSNSAPLPVVSIPPPPAEIPKSEPESIIPPPVIPVYKPRPSLTPDLDAEIARLQAHRAHLTSEYAQIAKATRRALHELDTATIDLRAAESRRRVADAHMDKARAGVLGIDAAPFDSPVL